jgi:hypothetical protein
MADWFPYWIYVLMNQEFGVEPSSHLVVLTMLQA